MPNPRIDADKRIRIDIRITEFSDPELYHALKRELAGMSIGAKSRRIRELLVIGLSRRGEGQATRPAAEAHPAQARQRSATVEKKPEPLAPRVSSPAQGSGGFSVEQSTEEPSVQQQVDALDGFDLEYSFG